MAKSPLTYYYTDTVEKLIRLRKDSIVKIRAGHKFPGRMLLDIGRVPSRFKNDFIVLNFLFSRLLLWKRRDLVEFTPYKITVAPLVQKNQWTAGTYVALNRSNGTLKLLLNYQKLADPKQFPEFPTLSLLWVICHEFRHKVQIKNPALRKSLEFPNWHNFNRFCQQTFAKDEDLINHIFHELNPAEADANMFASELTGIPFKGNAFNINDDSLKLLETATDQKPQKRKS